MIFIRSHRKKHTITIRIALLTFTIFTVFYVSGITNNYGHFLQNFTYNHSTVSSYNSSASVRVCCLIITSPKYFLLRAKAVNETWATHCDRYYFITEQPAENSSQALLNFTQRLPIAPIPNIIPGYLHLTQKTTLGLLFAHEHCHDICDWFIKADDDTFIIVENLRKFLSKQNSSEPVSFGYNFKISVKQGYHSGGASYVLSREALRRFYAVHNKSEKSCHEDGGSEDIEIAICLRICGVYPGRSLDEKNRELFHPFSFFQHFFGTVPKWLQAYAQNPVLSGYDCCGSESISFHYMNPSEMYLIDFFLYKSPVQK